MGDQGGRTLLGYVVGLATGALVLAAGAGALAPALRAREVEGAVRLIEARFRAAAWRALQSGRDEAFLVDETRSELLHLRDAEGDGISLRDVEAGRETLLARLTLRQTHPRARLGPVPWAGVPRPPEGPGLLDPDEPGVRFGPERLARFTAAGHAQPGSLLVIGGGTKICSVVVSGAGGRVRSFCYEREEGVWRRR